MMFNRSSIAALSAAMMLTLSACSGGAQVSAESNASTSASAESASTEASATPTATPSPIPTGPSGSEIELIYASMDVNSNTLEAADATDKAAHAALEQHFRLWNAWRHGDIEHTSDEELVRYVHKDVLESVKKTVENFYELSQEAPANGDIIFRDAKTKEIYGSIKDDGSRVYNTGVVITYCEDWSDLRRVDGEKVDSPLQTREITFIRRAEDGAFVIAKMRTVHKGCGGEAGATSEATAAAQSE
ncbi:hypothetical protein [Rothia mucilaginosa]|uniref:hypothetical protein n=1 Tax=Rothia mucilaginosa TaxID=43675 RepID=UPI00080A7FF8|nr:hypothetical protein [Rothia mucilaginosa]